MANNIPKEFPSEYLPDIRAIMNVVGYELYKTKTEVTTLENGVKQVTLDEDDIQLCIDAATRILKEMMILGWSKAAPGTGRSIISRFRSQFDEASKNTT